jgi:hypothetical protein
MMAEIAWWRSAAHRSVRAELAAERRTARAAVPIGMPPATIESARLI